MSSVKLSINARPNAAGMIASVMPTRGPFHGGNLVTITGKSLITDTPGDLVTVLLGGHRVAHVVSQSPTQVVVKAAKLHTGVHKPGLGTLVVVSRRLGQTKLNAAYRYNAPPHVVKVSASAGPRQGGNMVVLHGTNLCSKLPKNGGIDAEVRLASVPATVTRCTRNGHALFVQASALKDHSTQTVQGDIHVSSKMFGKARVPHAYTYRASPQITNVTPLWGPAAGGNAIKVSGSSLTAGRGTPGEAVQVLFGNQPAQVVSYSPSAIQIQAPPRNTDRCVKVEVVSAAHGKGSTGSRLYCYHDQPIIETIEPDTGSADGGMHVKVSGKHLHTGDVQAVFFGRHRAQVLAAPSHGRYVLVRTPRFGKDEEGHRMPITVKSHSSGKAKLEAGHGSGFLVTRRGHISKVTPSSGPLSGATRVTIVGSGLTSGDAGDLQGVWLNGVKAQFVDASPTEVVVMSKRAARASKHAAPVVIRSTSRGLIKSPRLASTQFRYTALPHIHHVKPETGFFKGGHTMEIKGTGLCQADCTDLLSVRIGTAEIKKFIVRSPRRIVVRVPHANIIGGSGSKTVAVKSKSRGTALLPDVYMVQPKEARATVFPTNVPMNGGTRVTIATNTLTQHSAEYRAWLAGVPAEVVSVEPRRITVMAGDASAKAPAHPRVGRAQSLEGEVVLEEKRPHRDGYVVLKRRTGVRFKYNAPCEITRVAVVRDRSQSYATVMVEGHHLGFGDETVTLDGLAAQTRLRQRRRHDVVSLEVEPLHHLSKAPSVVVSSPRVGSCKWSPTPKTAEVQQLKGMKKKQAPAAEDDGVTPWNDAGAAGANQEPVQHTAAADPVRAIVQPKHHYNSPTTSFEVVAEGTLLQQKANAAPIPQEVVTALPVGYETGTVMEGAKFMADRRCYAMTQVPAKFKGMVHLRGPNFTRGKPIEFVVSQNTDVYVAIDSRHANPIKNKGFKKMKDTITLGGCHRPTKMHVYVARQQEAGLMQLNLKQGYMHTAWLHPSA
jgi:hypothetical protein